MAYDKAVDSTALETGLRTIGDAIRAKGGTSDPLEFPQGMADAVTAISGGGVSLPHFKIVSVEDILYSGIETGTVQNFYNRFSESSKADGLLRIFYISNNAMAPDGAANYAAIQTGTNAYSGIFAAYGNFHVWTFSANNKPFWISRGATITKIVLKLEGL